MTDRTDRAEFTRPAHRPRLLDEAMFKKVIDTLRLGVPISLVCQQCGIAESTYFKWTSRGYAEQQVRERIEADPECEYSPDENEQVYLDFYLSTVAARADAAVRNMGYLQQVARGGFVTEEVTRRYRNEDGEMVEEKVTKKSPPDWRAAAWYLERSHRTEFSKGADRVEVSGPGGTPVAIAGESAELAAKLVAFLGTGAAEPTDLAPQTDPAKLLEAAADPEDDDSDVYDAELVED